MIAPLVKAGGIGLAPLSGCGLLACLTRRDEGEVVTQSANKSTNHPASVKRGIQEEGYGSLTCICRPT